jgi:uncharacterized cupin superfamily protein
MCSTPAHIGSAEEEIFVLSGSGWSWQQLGAEGEVRMDELREGDCIVHLAGAGAPHAEGRNVRRPSVLGRGGCGLGADRFHVVRVPPGDEGAPPHCHSIEDEFFVVLDAARSTSSRRRRGAS